MNDCDGGAQDRGKTQKSSFQEEVPDAADPSGLGTMTHPCRKRLLWISRTTIPIYLMLTLFMPPGFAGNLWMVLVMFVFLWQFIALLISESSCTWNGIIAFVFWMPMVGLHLMYPGTETVKNGEVHEGVLWILTVAVVHASIQLGIRALLNLGGDRRRKAGEYVRAE